MLDDSRRKYNITFNADYNYTPDQHFISLLTSEDVDMNVAKYIREAFEKRDSTII